MLSPKGSNRNPYEEKSAMWWRYNCIEELVKTERDYIRDITILIDLYHHPLRQNGLITIDEHRMMFGNIEQLVPLNKQLLKDLEASPWPYEKLLVGEIFLRFVEFFKMYKVFTQNRPTFILTYEQLKKSNAQFRAFLETQMADPRSNNLGLTDYHIKPLQRLTKYPLLLKALRERTPQDHPDYTNIVLAEQKIGDVVVVVNESQRLNDENSRIVELQNTIEDVGELVSPTRRLLFEGEFAVRNSVDDKPSIRTLFLFNDLVLVTLSKGVVKGKSRFVCKAKMTIAEVRLVFVAEDTLKHTFTLEWQGKKFVLSAPNDQVKDTWYKKIYNLKKEFQMSLVRPPGTMGHHNPGFGSLKKGGAVGTMTKS